MAPSELLAWLLDRDITVEVVNGSIVLEGEYGDEVVDLVRENKPQLIEWLTDSEKCFRCQSETVLVDDGLWCSNCNRLAWISDDRGLVRADFADTDFDGEAPSSVPICFECGRYCSIETATGLWRCAGCTMKETERRRQVRQQIARVHRRHINSNKGS